MTRYAELDVTTNFSFLRGGSHGEELVATAKALGLAAIAVTDRNTLAGVVRAHLAAKELGIKFVVGSRLDLEDAPSLLAYPTDRASYGRLCRLLTLGQMRAEKGKCTLRLADVATHARGLIFIALPPEDWHCSRRDRATHSFPPLDGEGGEAEGRAGWGNQAIAQSKTPPPGAQMRADLPTRGRYGASGEATDNIIAFPRETKGQGDGAANSSPSPKGEGGPARSAGPGGGQSAPDIRVDPRPDRVHPRPDHPPCRGREKTSALTNFEQQLRKSEQQLRKARKCKGPQLAPPSPLVGEGGEPRSGEPGEGDGPQTQPHPEERRRRVSKDGQSIPLPPPAAFGGTLPARGREGVCVASPDSQLDFEQYLLRIKQALDAKLYLAASHAYRGDDRARIEALAQLAERTGIPLVATNAVLYHASHRRALQDVLTCIREKCTIHDAGLRLEANAERHLKPPQEMARLFQGHEDALARTLEIADACSFSLDELQYEYPDEPVPEGKTPQSHLEDLTWQGARWRFPDGIPNHVYDTLVKELALIAKLDYARYFLTVHDIVHYARSLNILCQGRGSAANSVVCYCLAITNVDPTEIDLLFERFVSPERKEPPDIDVDFEHERREEVIQYIYARYGRDRAGIAATVISYRGRSAIREVGKALGLSEDTVAALATTIWGLSNSALPEEYVRQAGLDPSDPLLARCLELTQELIGFPRHLSQHVGGFVLTRGPLSEVVPIGNGAMADRTFIEWDKDDLDALGLLKVDVLGLGMLTCIRKSFAFLQEHYGIELGLDTVPRDDPAVYDMLCKADSIGVFQVESRAQMNMLPRLRPRTFYDLVIEVAIVRPGPIQGDMVHPYLRRRSGMERPDYPSPDPKYGDKDELKQVLGKTLGVPLFQEQAMRLAMVAAKFSSEEANELRRAMATFRRRGTIDKLRDKMVGRMASRGYPQDFAERCFEQIKGFGKYGFPESHAASFAHLVYVSAWIKCHYPAAFAAALLNSQPMGFYAPAQILRCATDHGVEAREVDVNHSLWDCTLEPISSRMEQNGIRDRAANSPLPPCGGARPLEERSEGGESEPKTLSPLLTPLPALPHKGGGGASGNASNKLFALRLGLRQIDGLREDDVQRLVSIRDGIAPYLNPHLFAPPRTPPHPPSHSLGHPLPRGERGTCGTATNSNPSPLVGEGGERQRREPGEGEAPQTQAHPEERRRRVSKDGPSTPLTPLPTLPHKGGGGASGDGTERAASSLPPLNGEGGEAAGRAGWGERSRCEAVAQKKNPPPGAQMRADLPTRGRYGASGNAQEKGYSAISDLWRRSGISRASIEKLAAADAFRSMGLDRRQALWEVRGLPKEIPLPLFEHADAAETGAEPIVALPLMPLPEHVVNDYRTIRLSLKGHPMKFLRERVRTMRILSCAELRNTKDGMRVKVAGVVLVRQRPGSAAGVVFMTIEDETGVANSVIWPQVLERMRVVVMGARLVVVHGRVQRYEDIIHVVAERLEDRSDWLRLLTEDEEKIDMAVANADEVKRPDPGSWHPAPGKDDPPLPLSPADHVKHPLPSRERPHPRWHPRRHPRAERIIPKSRDFH